MKYEYDAYGNRANTPATGEYEQPWRFSTKWLDAESGLSYYGYRYYSARMGRWISRDPIEEAGGTNLCSFVVNDPFGAVDPLGLLGCCSSQVAPQPESQPTTLPAASLFIETTDFLLSGTIDIKSWLGWKSKPGVLAQGVSMWTRTQMTITDNYLEHYSWQAGFGLIASKANEFHYAVPTVDRSCYKASIGLSLRASAPLSLEDRNGGELHAFTNSFNEVALDGKMLVKELCSCVEGKATLEMSGSLTAEVRSGGRWVTKTGRARHRDLQHFSTCDSNRKKKAVGGVNGSAGGTTEITAWSSETLEVLGFGLRSDGGSVEWSLRIEGTLYEYE